jgi:ubiquinone/menaquinone biosynthesis C-methylase UbiE
MYDKHLINAEIDLIKEHILPNTKVLDVGCGEGEGTLVYSEVEGVTVHGADFSETRLKMAAERLKDKKNVVLKQIDFLEDYILDNDYDTIVSQRFLINLMDWSLQSKVLHDLGKLLKIRGHIVLLEGSEQGVNSLNEFRAAWGLEPIPVKWHNLFLDDKKLIDFMRAEGFKMVRQDGLGTYFLLTRGIRPTLDEGVNWDCEFNRLAATKRMRNLLQFNTKFSRLKLWSFRKEK